MRHLLQQWGQYLCAHPRFAATVALVAGVCAIGNVPVAWIAGVIIALTMLHVGPKEGVHVMLWALIPAVALLWLTHWFSGVVMLTLLGMTGLMAFVLLRTKSWILMLEVGVCVGMLLVGTLHSLWDVQAWWQLRLQRALLGLTQLNALQAQQMSDFIAQFATGLESVFILFAVLVNIFLACCWCACLSKKTQNFRTERLAALKTRSDVPCDSSQRERPEKAQFDSLLQMRLGWLELGMLALNGILVWGGVDVAIDMVPLILMPFVCVGLCVVHVLLRRCPFSRMFFILFYILLLLFFPYMLLLLVTLGIFDCGVHFRTRFA